MSNSNQRVVVTVGDDHLSGIQDVAQKLQQAGLQNASVLSTSGIITGEVSAENVQALSGVPGVTGVEPDQEMRAI